VLGQSPDTVRSPQTFFSDTTGSPIVRQTTVRQQAATQPVRTGYESTKSPVLAVLLSAVLPGAGQIYNESYWKAPLIWGVGGYWVSEWIYLDKKYREFRVRYSQSLETNPPFGNAQFKRVRDFYRDERDKFAWYIGALYFANLLDAYVGANLYDFNVSSDLGENGVLVPRFSASIRIPF